MFENKKDFYSYQISSIKNLGDTNPELLEKWRAQRAADYIAKLKNPEKPPQKTSLDAKPFKPAGTLQNTMKKVLDDKIVKKKISNSTKIEDEESEQNLQLLIKELEKTEEQLSMQKLKIGLNSKPKKSYQKDK
jgi:hypothetical protein